MIDNQKSLTTKFCLIFEPHFKDFFNISTVYYDVTKMTIYYRLYQFFYLSSVQLS